MDEQYIISVIKNILHSENINTSTYLKDIVFDSLSYVKFIVEIERNFSIEFNEELLIFDKNIKIEDFINYISNEKNLKTLVEK